MKSTTNMASAEPTVAVITQDVGPTKTSSTSASTTNKVPQRGKKAVATKGRKKPRGFLVRGSLAVCLLVGLVVSSMMAFGWDSFGYDERYALNKNPFEGTNILRFRWGVLSCGIAASLRHSTDSF